jgi:hypothetical protein
VISSDSRCLDTSFVLPDAIATVGAIEVVGDLNGNGFVDAANCTVWGNSLGAPVPAGTGGEPHETARN